MEAAVTHGGDHAALISGGERMSFADLIDRSARLAGGLQQLGLGKGDIAALWLQNDPNWLVAFLACARLGVNAIALNTRFRQAELADVFSRLAPRAIFYQPAYRGIDFAAIVDDARRVHNSGPKAEIHCAAAAGEAGLTVEDLVARHRPSGKVALTGADDLVMFTTSGTIGLPKFVQHTHGSVLRHADAVATGFGMTAPEATMLQALPYCGVFGFCQAMGALAAARPSVVLEAFDPDAAVAAIRRHRVTHFNATDDMLSACVNAARDLSDLSSLRLVGAAAFNRSADQLRVLSEDTGIPVVGLYGSSEAQALFARRSTDDANAYRCEAGGRPVSPEAQFRVRNIDTGERAGPGEAGELELRGPSLFSGYVGDADATADAWTDDGFFRTGDLAVMEKTGGFRFDARMGDVIRLGGFLVNPDEISEHIETIDGIRDCVVVGVQTDVGTRAAAFFIRDHDRSGAFPDADAVQALCREHLAPFKVPALVQELEAFPVADGPNGIKVQRGELRALAREILDQ